MEFKNTSPIFGKVRRHAAEAWCKEGAALIQKAQYD
jgi:hypothetical protein